MLVIGKPPAVVATIVFSLIPKRDSLDDRLVATLSSFLRKARHKEPDSSGKLRLTSQALCKKV